MGSADLMPRNLDHRVEALVAISEPAVADRLMGILDMELAPNVQSWLLASDGSWTRSTDTGLLDLHTALEDEAIERRRAGRSTRRT